MQLQVAILVGCGIVQFVSSVLVLQQCCDGSVAVSQCQCVAGVKPVSALSGTVVTHQALQQVASHHDLSPTRSSLGWAVF